MSQANQEIIDNVTLSSKNKTKSKNSLYIIIVMILALVSKIGYCHNLQKELAEINNSNRLIEVKKDYKEAYKLIKQGFDKGETSAIGLLGEMYFEGKGVEVNYNEAIKLYKLGIEKGDPKSQTKLGEIYFNGYYLKQDYNEAFKLCKLASDMGDADALVLLGQMYLNGQGVNKNEDEAFKLFTSASDKGNTDALIHLANMYIYGLGLEKNKIKGLKLINEAVQKNNTKAMIWLGSYYCFDQDNINYDEAIKYYKMCYENGNPEGLFYLANMYDIGIGLQKDINEAIRLYKLSADNGFKNALMLIAFKYEMGNDVNLDYKEAYNIYKYLSDIGNPEATWHLAKCYCKGEGTEQNYKEALKLFRLSYFRWNNHFGEFNLFNECINKLGIEKTDEDKQVEREVIENLKKWQENKKQEAYREYLKTSKEIKTRFETIKNKQPNQFLSRYDFSKYIPFSLIVKNSKRYTLGAKINQKCNDVDIFFYEGTDFIPNESKYAGPCITDNEEGKEIFNKFWENLGKEQSEQK